MSERDALRGLLTAHSAGRSAFGPVALAAAIYLAIGIGVYGFVAITWDDPPGPLPFVVVFDLLFVLLAIGGLTFRTDEEPDAGTLSGLRVVLIASGGAWQIIKSVVKGVLFVLPYAAFDALRSVMPPMGAVEDSQSLKVLRRISVLKGGVPLSLFRYLCGNPSSASFNAALEAAAYLDAAHVRGRGEEAKIVPSLQLAKLAAALASAQKKPATATRPGTTRVPTEAGKTPLPPK